MLKKIVLTSIVVILSSLFVYAGSDEERHITFLGFSKDGKYVLVDVKDPNIGNSINVYAVNGRKLKTKKFYYTPIQKLKLTKQLKKKFKITDKGTNSMQDPSQKYSFSGVMQGKYFKILVMKGNKVAVFDKLPGLKKGEMNIKEIWWASNGRSMAIIINRKLSTPGFGFNVDTIKTYIFFPSTLRFK